MWSQIQAAIVSVQLYFFITKVVPHTMKLASQSHADFFNLGCVNYPTSVFLGFFFFG
jgi:hypothetical protein